MRTGLKETFKFIGYVVGLLIMIPFGFMYIIGKTIVEHCADFDKDSVYETED